ncbi:barrier-to-autointegration factor-like protein isoform X2 [Tachyglossus aculeatus]|uniref:barrier-to-autointegration factor-like protein isoform X2 n=1 Tax=Tachyglossus aculeatus TaxID=9261 RepID=UPI0018F57B35|nr:barrier-to-autointegration factor-like protein isoform X2 [Tachyglossus aculeatus]
MAESNDTNSVTPGTPMKSEVLTSGSTCDLQECQEVPQVMGEMESASEMQSIFESQPMGEKDITEVDGITTTLGEHLVAKGFDKGSHLIGYVDGNLKGKKVSDCKLASQTAK